MTVTVACVLRSGGAYGPEYVRRLRAGVERPLPGARFVCLSDVPEVATHALAHGWPGWWSKLELFRPGLLTGATLYVDLDTVIAGGLAPLAEAIRPGRFLMLRDFTRPERRGSGVMGWHGDWSAIYRAFAGRAGHVMGTYQTGDRWGDQAFIAEHAGEAVACWQDHVPGAVASYKLHGRTPRARVVCFHGRPRPHEIGWAV